MAISETGSRLIANIVFLLIIHNNENWRYYQIRFLELRVPFAGN